MIDRNNPHKQVGRIIAERYELRRVLGVGGMGQVFRAHQLDLGRDVAIKLLAPREAHADLPRRFLREAQAASRLRHPNVAAIYDFGESDDQPFMAMELVEGPSLATVIDTERPLRPERIVNLLRGVCGALEEAHALGILHRDLKPANILVAQTRQGEVAKVVDFGLAFTMGAPTGDRLTADNSVMGTPEYMSPEQCRGSDLDARSDLWALGVVLYEMLVGEVPFSGPTRMDTMMKAVLSVPKAPSQCVAIATPALRALEQLCLSALSKMADGRPRDAAAFRDQLERSLATSADDAEAPVGRPTRASRVRAAALDAVPELAVTTTGLSVCVLGDDDGALDSPVALVRTETPAEHLPASVVDDHAVDLARYDLLIVRLDDGIGPDELRALLDRTGASRTMVLGPSAFDLMTLSLELGVVDYIPTERAAKELPSRVRRTLRRLSRKR